MDRPTGPSACRALAVSGVACVLIFRMRLRRRTLADQEQPSIRGRLRDAPADARERSREQRHRDHRRRHRAEPDTHPAGRASNRARPQRGANGRPGRDDAGLYPRHQRQPRQGLHRRDRGQRSQHDRWIVRFRACPDLRHRQDRGLAGAAKRALWLGRYRRRHQHHHQVRLGAAEIHRQPRWRLVRDLRSVGGRARLGEPVQLCRRLRPFPFRRPAGDADRSGAAGYASEPGLLRQQERSRPSSGPV